jgi:predicted amidohydrolase YtcJ
MLSSTAWAQQPPADLIVTNAHIYTVDEGRPLAEAMAISDGRRLGV